MSTRKQWANIGTEIDLPVGDGALAAIDFGGSGAPVLFVHGTGQNAAAWTDVAAHLVGHCRAVAIDLRGHGQTRLDSIDPEQYWRDIAKAVAALSWKKPILVGHSGGGYGVTAAVAAQLVEPAALCIIDGMVLDDRETSIAQHAALRSPQSLERLQTQFRYGWKADDQQLHAYVEEAVRNAETDWLNAGAQSELIEVVAKRSFLHTAPGWTRKPTVEEIIAITALSSDAVILPSVDIYQRITCPITMVLADRGFYASRRDQVHAIANAGSDRNTIEIASNHNAPMSRPAEIAAIIRDACNVA